MKIGFIGLGNMGAAIAANLVKAGRDVTVYNRTASKAEPLVALGAKAAKTIAEAARGDVVMTMLAEDHAVEETVFGAGGILASLPKGALHISSSTISVALSDRLTEAHAKAGQRFIAAPVFGRPDAAAAKMLFVAAAGPADAIETATPLLADIGQKTFVLGAKPSSANLVKLSGNFLIAVFTGLNEHFVKASGAAQFYLYAGMLFVVSVIFMFCANWFRGREPIPVAPSTS